MTPAFSFTLPAAPSTFAQRGMVLPVTLVLILLLTLLGTAAMRNSSLQEHLAHNQREQVQAFNAAEAAMQAAIARITELHQQDVFNTQDMVDVWTGEVSNYPKTASAHPPKYEFIKIVLTEDDTRLPNSGSQSALLFRIISTGFGVSLDKDDQPLSRVQLESTYLISQ